MLKKFLALAAMLYAAASFAAVDVNQATAADLDSVKGIGPSISSKILDERKKGNFKDWTDFVERVKGVGDGNAAKFSAEGLTVNGATYKGAMALPAKPAKPDKPAMPKIDDKAAMAKPAVAAISAPAMAAEPKKDLKAEAKMPVAETMKKAEATKMEAAKPAMDAASAVKK